MEIRKHTLAFGLVLALGANGTGVAFAQDMSDSQSSPGGGMMSGSSSQGGMMQDMMGGSQGGMGPDMMKGMMGGGQGGMGPGMMSGGMMPCPMMGGAGMGMMQEMLEPKQRNEMRELMQEHRPAQFERMGRLMNLRDDLMAEMHGQRPDPEEVKTLHGQMAELHGEMMAEMVRMRNAMHDLMTDEQRQQLQQATPESDVDPDDHDAHH
ncbi:Spy/CpxP family protein refolding chaperone [Halomonas daqiaonensis]|uniref:Protein refolding chaperone Spy/CpxP family n=1 Tax=Halomonas daqiaonensis TaxID=650850 RepID=A0A1H7JEL0_9GAMM|nr:Spy/CpxP family protein refolding chaperone [Halomonas daqiaonensis]SEK72966.1 protein refolding chaperone Spy/CpxP family [Halomonas daqiaonensis]